MKNSIVPVHETGFQQKIVNFLGPVDNYQNLRLENCYARHLIAYRTVGEVALTELQWQEKTDSPY